MALWISIGVVALLLVWLIAVYNRLVRLRALVREGFSGITVQLRRRTDLVPNLVSTVEGYASHERGVLEAVTEQRNASAAARGVGATAAERRAHAVVNRTAVSSCSLGAGSLTHTSSTIATSLPMRC